MIIGVYYAQNMLNVLRLELKAVFDLQPAQFNWIYAYSKLPNIILSVLNGILFDNIGFRNGAAIFTLCVVAGTVL
jgi:nitrate/nitrite transporter NarK